MALWLLVIFLVGALLAFAPGFVAEHDLAWCLGVVVMFVSVGLGMRVEALRRRGAREKLMEKVKRLEQTVARAGGAVSSSGPVPEDKPPAGE